MPPILEQFRPDARGFDDEPQARDVGLDRTRNRLARLCSGGACKSVGIKEAKAHFSELVRAAANGELIVLTDYGRSLAVITFKDLRFGMGLSVLRIADPQRRDRLLLLNAFAIVLWTLLGAAGESLGMDRHLKVNTAKHRTHSLFRQGCMLYELIPNMPEVRLRPLVERFSEYITQDRALAQTFSVV